MAKKEASNTRLLAAGIIVIILLILVATVWGSYNSLVRLNQKVDESWANVETQYQRRFDLIPNLVSVVESYATFEKQTLTEITATRSRWQTQTPDQIEDSENQFQSALSKLLLISENYPDLKASSNFRALQDSLAETENMVSVARTRYNAAVRDYNSAVRVFPSNVVAGMFGFSEKEYFAAQDGAQNAPTVNI